MLGFPDTGDTGLPISTLSPSSLDSRLLESFIRQFDTVPTPAGRQYCRCRHKKALFDILEFWRVPRHETPKNCLTWPGKFTLSSSHKPHMRSEASRSAKRISASFVSVHLPANHDEDPSTSLGTTAHPAWESAVRLHSLQP